MEYQITACDANGKVLGEESTNNLNVAHDIADGFKAKWSGCRVKTYTIAVRYGRA